MQDQTQDSKPLPTKVLLASGPTTALSSEIASPSPSVMERFNTFRRSVVYRDAKRGATGLLVGVRNFSFRCAQLGRSALNDPTAQLDEVAGFIYSLKQLPSVILGAVPTFGLAPQIFIMLRPLIMLMHDDRDCFPDLPERLQAQIRTSCAKLEIALPTFLCSNWMPFACVGVPASSIVFLPADCLQREEDAFMFTVNHELAHIALNHSMWTFLTYLKGVDWLLNSPGMETHADNVAASLTVTERPIRELMASALCRPALHNTAAHDEFRKRMIDRLAESTGVSLADLLHLGSHGTTNNRVVGVWRENNAAILCMARAGDDIVIHDDSTHTHGDGVHCEGICKRNRRTVGTQLQSNL